MFHSTGSNIFKRPREGVRAKSLGGAPYLATISLIADLIR